MSGPVRRDVRALEPGDAAVLDDVARHLEGGGLLGYPTETVYGFGCALDPAPLAALRALKRREGERPFLVLLPDADAAEGLAWTDEARELARLFWPGALTLVLADPGATFPEAVRSEAGGVAVRVSPHPWARALAGASGRGVTSTSANVPGGAPARDGAGTLEAARALGADAGMLVLDAGTLPPSAPSTLVDCTRPTPVVLREGATPLQRLRCALPRLGR